MQQMCDIDEHHPTPEAEPQGKDDNRGVTMDDNKNYCGAESRANIDAAHAATLSVELLDNDDVDRCQERSLPVPKVSLSTESKVCQNLQRVGEEDSQDQKKSSQLANPDVNNIQNNNCGSCTTDGDVPPQDSTEAERNSPVTFRLGVYESRGRGSSPRNTGTGTGTIAEHLRGASPRRQRPFSAAPAVLDESRGELKGPRALRRQTGKRYEKVGWHTVPR